MISRTKKFSIYEVDNTSEVVILSKVNDSTQLIFDDIYNGITCEDASNVSLLNRKENKEKYKNLISYTLTYGEINSIQPIRNIFRLLKQLSLLPTNGKFYDLGSGTGRPVIAASLLHPFNCCIGIELLHGLHSLSLQALEQWKIFKESSRYNNNIRTKEVFFIQGSMLDLSILDWTDGDIVFANSTCYSDDMMQELYNLSKNMKLGSVFITLSQPLMNILRMKQQQRKLNNFIINNEINNIEINQINNNDKINDSLINIDNIITSNYWKIIGESRQAMSWYVI